MENGDEAVGGDAAVHYEFTIRHWVYRRCVSAQPRDHGSCGKYSAILRITTSDKIEPTYCIASCKQGGTARYADLIDGNVTESELKAYLVEGENVAVTVRIPKNMRDVAKQAAELTGVSFTSLVKMSLIEHLTEKEG